MKINKLVVLSILSLVCGRFLFSMEDYASSSKNNIPVIHGIPGLPGMELGFEGDRFISMEGDSYCYYGSLLDYFEAMLEDAYAGIDCAVENDSSMKTFVWAICGIFELFKTGEVVSGGRVEVAVRERMRSLSEGDLEIVLSAELALLLAIYFHLVLNKRWIAPGHEELAEAFLSQTHVRHFESKPEFLDVAKKYASHKKEEPCSRFRLKKHKRCGCYFW